MFSWLYLISHRSEKLESDNDRNGNVVKGPYDLQDTTSKPGQLLFEGILFFLFNYVEICAGMFNNHILSKISLLSLELHHLLLGRIGQVVEGLHDLEYNTWILCKATTVSWFYTKRAMQSVHRKSGMNEETDFSPWLPYSWRWPTAALNPSGSASAALAIVSSSLWAASCCSEQRKQFPSFINYWKFV